MMQKYDSVFIFFIDFGYSSVRALIPFSWFWWTYLHAIPAIYRLLLLGYHLLRMVSTG